MNKKKKAFTLTELLVVVVVIGVLSAVVLPKFNKVIETRRMTEAEELMGAIRTEQEKRCALDKNYLTQISDMSDIVKSDQTKNYKLTLASTGVNASRKEKYNYTLSIPSYADGRICCSGADCDKLNKNYPKCEDFTPEASPEACAGEVAETPAVYECMGSATQKCGCQDKGTQSRTCNTSTGEWSDWGACSVSDSCECTGAKQDRRACTASGTCGFETRSAACNSTTGEWEYGSWDKSACAAKPETEKECDNSGYTGILTRVVTCKNGAWETGRWNGTCEPICSHLDNLQAQVERCEISAHPGVWNNTTCTCDCPEKYSVNSLTGECENSCSDSKRMYCEEEDEYGGTKGRWDEDTCSCKCPSGLSMGPKGSCICPPGQDYNGYSCYDPFFYKQLDVDGTVHRTEIWEDPGECCTTAGKVNNCGWSGRTCIECVDMNGSYDFVLFMDGACRGFANNEQGEEEWRDLCSNDSISGYDCGGMNWDDITQDMIDKDEQDDANRDWDWDYDQDWDYDYDYDYGY